MMIKTWALEHYNPSQRIDTVREEIVEELCAAIKKSPYTYEKLAELAGVCPQTIGKWVAREVVTPRLNKMVAVGTVLGLRLTWMVNRPN